MAGNVVVLQKIGGVGKLGNRRHYMIDYMG
jgi:hypothetical protein